AGMVLARGGSLAGRDEHRPPQRRLLPGLPADHPAVDGSDLPPGHAQDRAEPGARTERPARAGPRVFPVGDRDHHAGRAGADPGVDAQGAPRAGGRCRHHGLHAERESRDDVRAAAVRHQGRPDHRRAGRDPRGHLRQDAPCRARIRPRHRTGHPEVVRRVVFDPMAELSRRGRPRPRRGSDRNPTMNESMANTDEGPRREIIADTFAEAFPMTAARAIVTADTRAWAMTAAETMTGYATSVI